MGAVILSWNEAMNEHGPAMLYRRWLPGDPPACDCPQHPSGTRRRDGQPPRQHHRWNCPLTPIWAQTMRDLDCNPWTVVVDAMKRCTPCPHVCPICGEVDVTRFLVRQYDDPICHECWQLNRHSEPEAWHCFDCEKFLRGGDRMVLWHRGVALYLCREHFDWRHQTTEGDA